jgi:hypothetical protein
VEDLARARANERAVFYGRVWYDINANSKIDQGEKGVEGVMVKLYRYVKAPDGKKSYFRVKTKRVESDGSFIIPLNTIYEDSKYYLKFIHGKAAYYKFAPMIIGGDSDVKNVANGNSAPRTIKYGKTYEVNAGLIVKIPYPEGFLKMSDQDLFQYAVTASENKVPKIGKYCWITDRRGKNGTCDFYAKARPNAIDVGLDGTPAGTGCINERGSTFCWYDNLAHLTVDERKSMCTDDYIANGAAQIRWAIQNGLCDVAPDFMSMSDEDLFQYAVNAGKGVGPRIYAYCFIQDATDLDGTCNYYAKGEPRPGDGVPGIGTGCISGPGSWGGPPWYQDTIFLTDEERASMSTDDYIANGAAQIRWAIQNGICDAPDFKLLSDEDLFHYAVNAGKGKVPRIYDYCYIEDATGKPSAACNYYAKGKPGPGYDGVPGAGTGCIVGKGSWEGTCWYEDPSFLTILTKKEVMSMCTDDYIANGAAQIRWAMQHGLCGDAPDFMSMSDEDLFQYAVNAGKDIVPKIYSFCFIEDATGKPGAACVYYAKGKSPGFDGVPEGTGCIVEPESYCWYENSSFLTDEEIKSMCTNDWIANGAAQIRWAIKKGLCHRDGVPSIGQK